MNSDVSFEASADEVAEYSNTTTGGKEYMDHDAVDCLSTVGSTESSGTSELEREFSEKHGNVHCSEDIKHRVLESLAEGSTGRLIQDYVVSYPPSISSPCRIILKNCEESADGSPDPPYCVASNIFATEEDPETNTGLRLFSHVRSAAVQYLNRHHVSIPDAEIVRTHFAISKQSERKEVLHSGILQWDHCVEDCHIRQTHLLESILSSSLQAALHHSVDEFEAAAATSPQILVLLYCGHNVLFI